MGLSFSNPVTAALPIGWRLLSGIIQGYSTKYKMDYKTFFQPTTSSCVASVLSRVLVLLHHENGHSQDQRYSRNPWSSTDVFLRSYSTLTFNSFGQLLQLGDVLLDKHIYLTTGPCDCMPEMGWKIWMAGLPNSTWVCALLSLTRLKHAEKC